MQNQNQELEAKKYLDDLFAQLAARGTAITSVTNHGTLETEVVRFGFWAANKHLIAHIDLQPDPEAVKMMILNLALHGFSEIAILCDVLLPKDESPPFPRQQSHLLH